MYLIEYGFLQHESSIFVRTLFSLNRELRKQSAKHLLREDEAQLTALEKNDPVVVTESSIRFPVADGAIIVSMWNGFLEKWEHVIRPTLTKQIDPTSN